MSSSTSDLKKRWNRTKKEVLEKPPHQDVYLEQKLAYANLKIDLLIKFVDELVGRVSVEDDLK